MKGTVSDFTDDRLNLGVTCTDAYDEYCQWCIVNGIEPRGMGSFVSEMEKIGAVRRKSGKRMRFVGLRIRR